MKRLLVALASLAAWAGTNPLGGQTVTPEMTREYEITPAAGSWMICATSYMGSQSSELALKMVQEIRAKYQLPAYVYNRSAEQRRQQQEEIQKKREQQLRFLQQASASPIDPSIIRVRTVRIEDQFAVLVGGYKDMEAARRALNDFRKLAAQSPPSRELSPHVTVQDLGEGAETGNSPKGLGSFGSFFAQAAPQGGEVVGRQAVNPFQTAFVTRNPTVPMEKPENKPDPFLKELNAHESYSLLKCKKPWTLVLKDFQGAAMIQTGQSSGVLGKLGLGKSRDLLSAAGAQAHELARVLREHPELKYEAYVLHTRYYSLVTVGGYDSPNDPRLMQMQRQLANLQMNAFTGMQIPMFAQPLPMEVPRP